MVEFFTAHAWFFYVLAPGGIVVAIGGLLVPWLLDKREARRDADRRRKTIVWPHEEREHFEDIHGWPKSPDPVSTESETGDDRD